METSKQAVNARKAGLDKHLAKGELNEFLDEFFNWTEPETIEENLEYLYHFALTSREFDAFSNEEKADLLYLTKQLSYLMYLLRDSHEFDQIKKLEKAYEQKKKLEKAAV
jgi:hypothetical protein